jgi:hypothetical protein
MLFLLFSLFLLCNADLTSDRLTNAQLWITRSSNPITMAQAYSPSVVDFPNIFHTLDDVGNFGPGFVAEEYDSLVTNLVFILGYNPIVLASTFDPFTTQWVDNNTLLVKYSTAVTAGANFTPGLTYKYVNNVVRNTEVIVFNNNSSLIRLGRTTQDPAAIKLFAAVNSELSVFEICGIIFQACNVTNATGYNYLSDTGFADFGSCVGFLLSLPPNNPCPYPQRSNTRDCRRLHAFSSLFLPNVHCSHVKPASMVCTDSCLPSCSNCDPNAKCVPEFPVINVPNPVYKCQCNNGYVGNGTVCTPKNCSFGNCPALFGSYECSTGLCMCTESFTQNPTGSSICTCPSPSQIFYNNSKPVCVPQGRCIDAQWQCNGQSYTQVKCVSVNNTFSLFNACVCNYGFNGGWEYPCSCPVGRRIVWSNTLNGDVCLNSTECTANWHCSTNRCSISPGQQVGTCVPSKRNLLSEFNNA